MQITTTDPVSTILTPTADDPLSASQAATDKRFAELLADTKESTDTLAEITKDGAKGYWNWKLKEMKKQITDEVMRSMNVTPEKLAAMSNAQRVDTENQIMKAVENRLQLAMSEDMKKKQNDKVAANNTLGSIISKTQDIALI